MDQETLPSDALTSSPHRALLRRLAWHLLALVLAILSLTAYLHFRAEGPAAAATGALIASALFGFVPLRDLVRLFFRVEGPLLHLVHVLGGLALALVPLSGAISGVPLLTRSAMAPFAIMGAAQALMHQDHPRNPQQLQAIQRFAASLPELAAFASPKALHSPADIQRAVANLSDVLTKAQALGQTELDADPGFQAALRRASTRLGVNLALDAMQVSLKGLPPSLATTAPIQTLQTQLAQTRSLIARGAPTRQ
ncbi:MAG TPA: hypothetical protein VG692_15710 [Gemmatimonadales bacterium]|nr:hypothetical protein [Gemmatimonadales bacterium]